MRQVIADLLVETMGNHGYDAIVCLSPENFAYVSGFTIPSQPLMRWRHAAVVVTANGRTAFLVVDMEESTVANQVGDTEIRAWGEFTDRPMQVLGEILSEMGLASARIGTELDYLPAGDYRELADLLPMAELLPAEKYLARLRQTKTAEEIQLMRRLSRIADESIQTALMSVRSGDSEMDLAAALTRTVYTLGADDFKLMIIATGPRSVFPNVGPSMRRLEHQDICRVEIFPIISGYHAGVCRTARVGSSPPRADEIWKNLVECKYLILDMIKPGVSSRAVYQEFIKHLSRLKLPPIKFVGHGIGLHLHEDPYLGMYSDEPLRAGMVLGIEPLVYNTGYGFGMQNKDMVLVTESGCELLSNFTDTDSLITIQ
jgi:Xaa-Pro aminopeptidase